MEYSNYLKYITHRQPITDHIVEHEDGACSVLISWSGIDSSVMSSEEAFRFERNYKSLLESLERKLKVSIEEHWWREKDKEIVPAYLELNKKVVRANDFVIPIRTDIAKMFQKYARTNHVAMVVTYRPVQIGLFNKSHAPSAKKRKKAVDVLNLAVSDIVSRLPGAVLENVETFCARFGQSWDRKNYLSNSLPNLDFRFPISEQIVEVMPEVGKDGFISLNGIESKVLVCYMYPAANQELWFSNLANIDIDMHVTRVAIPTSTDYRINKIDSNIRKEGALSSKNSQRLTNKVLSSANLFAQEVYDKESSILLNCTIITLYGNPLLSKEDNRTAITDIAKRITNFFDDNKGRIRSDASLQAHYYRVSQPGLGHHVKYLREDASHYLARTAPVITYDHGLVGGECLRLGDNQQPIGYSLLLPKIPHGFTVAMTGAGKGVDQVHEIIETYGLGMDYYILEWGKTYQDVVMALGGNYVPLDLSTAINPLPEYAICNRDPENPLPDELIEGTVEGLAFYLQEERAELSRAKSSAAQRALKNLYLNQRETKYAAPSMVDYLASLKNTDYANESQFEAAKQMYESLDNFLDGVTGAPFRGNSTFHFTDGLMAVDLKGIGDKSRNLAVIYLNTIALKYAQKAFFASDRPSTILFDELHKFMDIDPYVTALTCKATSRLGRKEKAFLKLITQGMSEIEMLDSEILGSATIRNLMYRQDKWEEIGHRLKLPEKVLNLWAGLKNPEFTKGYRQSIKQVVEKYYKLHLIVPPDLLDVASTDGEDLAFKDQLYKLYPDDVWRRIAELRNHRNLINALG